MVMVLLELDYLSLRLDGVWWKDVESYKVQMALKILLIPPHQIDVCT